MDEHNAQVGVVETAEAQRMARERGLDLVEIQPDATPPVCKILDYGKYRYEQSKKDKASKQRAKVTETKEVRLGRSMKIDKHDIAMRLDQARKFLLKGHKVQIVQNFRGREMVHRDRGDQRMRDVVAALEDIAKVEMMPKLAGRRMTMLLSPDKTKVEAFLRKNEAARAALEADDDDEDQIDLDAMSDDEGDEVEETETAASSGADAEPEGKKKPAGGKRAKEPEADETDEELASMGIDLSLPDDLPDVRRR